MNREIEAVLAIGLTLVLGVSFWLFSGQTSVTGSTGDTTPIIVDTEAAARGAVVASDAGCEACHSADGSSLVGPTWKGLAGSTRPLESGETVIADDTYLKTSIVDPAGQVVAGYDAVMPTTFGDQLSSDQINDLVAHIKSLAS